jgi:hypothetical protein
MKIPKLPVYVSPLGVPIRSAFDWMSSVQYLAQVSHALAGVSVIVISALFSIALRTGWVPTIITLVLGIMLASVKEFWFDLSSWGEGDSLSDSAIDFTFYMAGAAIGMGLAALAHHFART